MASRSGVQEGAARVVGVRAVGRGQQYEIEWRGHQATSWEPASRVRREVPELVKAFEEAQVAQQQLPPPREPNKEGPGPDTEEQREEGVPSEDKSALPLAADGSSMRAQMEALQRLVREQAQQLQRLQSSPQHSPAQSPQATPLVSPASSPQQQGASAATSRFARKEPRAQDLREYDGAPGAKLDEWLQELSLATYLYKLNAVEAHSFGVSRLRGAALQWWLSLSAVEQENLAEPDALAAALRSRFQPVTAAKVARAQLDALRQGTRHVNEYIAEFQRLHTQIGAASLGEANALHAFERGLRPDLAEKLRVQGVSKLQDAIAMAARVGGLTQANTSATATQAAVRAHQMEAESDEAYREIRIAQIAAQAALNAMQGQQTQNGQGLPTGNVKPPSQGYPRSPERSRGGPFRGRGGFGRGGRFGGPRPQPVVPGVPAEVVRQRLQARHCLRCGSDSHASFACPNAISASGN